MADEPEGGTQKAESGKRIIAVSGLSSGSYRGVTIFETPQGFAVALGTLVYSSHFLESIKGFIDSWYDAKKN